MEKKCIEMECKYTSPSKTNLLTIFLVQTHLQAPVLIISPLAAMRACR